MSTESIGEILPVAPVEEKPVIVPRNGFYNTGEEARDWPDIKNPATGTTLVLQPNEEVYDLVVPEGFNCCYLRPLTEKKGK